MLPETANKEISQILKDILGDNYKKEQISEVGEFELQKDLDTTSWFLNSILSI